MRIAAQAAAVDGPQLPPDRGGTAGEHQRHGAEMMRRQEQHQPAAGAAEFLDDQAGLPDERMGGGGERHAAQRRRCEIAQPARPPGRREEIARPRVAAAGGKVRREVELGRQRREVLVGEGAGPPAEARQWPRQPRRIRLPQVAGRIVGEQPGEQRQLGEAAARRQRMVERQVPAETRRRVHAAFPSHAAANAAGSRVPPDWSRSAFTSRRIFSAPVSRM